MDFALSRNQRCEIDPMYRKEYGVIRIPKKGKTIYPYHWVTEEESSDVPTAKGLDSSQNPQFQFSQSAIALELDELKDDDLKSPSDEDEDPFPLKQPEDLLKDDSNDDDPEYTEKSTKPKTKKRRHKSRRSSLLPCP